MPRCFEAYGQKYMNPKKIEQHHDVFTFGRGDTVQSSPDEHIWIWAPLVPISQNQGLPTFMEGSHHDADDKIDRPYCPILQPGSALMFDARIRTSIPNAGGGVIFAQAYDVASFKRQFQRA